ncbi:hypothetical protein N7468_004892 [Penicillium chermesinum]|uniref:Uncharacterized protein n=1 Tax=Penicillium chermesinum TaxID=63820 RepID=A0A9W9P9B6_9EURO|nr:uncharacterized protein N7468_004892 [Penicillium chermesinum]KAJ5240273.1 hypothetical protein N7468_004892 [Penicillium chermesinum]KAJ6167141.1 hypothetical protein N7470_002588 [Penicillium chermesinum]
MEEVHSISNEEVFDPAVHLQYIPPQKQITMQDLLLPLGEGTSPIAGTVPFSLLSAKGIRAYRKAMFQQEVLSKCSSSPFPGTLVLRDAVKYSKFIQDFWTHSETLRIVSEAAGVPLEIVMPTEIGHTNIQVEGSTIDEMKQNLKIEPTSEKVELSPADLAYDPLKDASAIIPWHYDSYPYVCVLMLSETDGMIGGETYIKKGDGTTQKVEGPQIGHAVILQGGEVQHLAARAKGVKERISTITSYRSKSPTVYDSSFMTNIRPYADLKSLYPEWTQYRLRKLKDEIVYHLQQIEKEPTHVQDQKGLATFVQSQISYLQQTLRQMITPEFEEKTIHRFGRSAYYEAPMIWEKVQTFPAFEALAASADDKRCWFPDSEYWMDLQASIELIRLKKPLKGAMGSKTWAGRRYYMGDELLRQGLNEVFLDWLEHTGLWTMYSESLS